MPKPTPLPAPGLDEAIRLYFDSMYFCDVGTLDSVFHPSASLFDADGGEVVADPITRYRQVIAERTPPARTSQPRQDKVLMIDCLSPTAALVNVRLRIHEEVFVDHLMFARGSHGWKIVAKLWHLERRHEPATAGSAMATHSLTQSGGTPR